MVIDFSVKNFKSFKDTQQISFVASNYDRDLPQNFVDKEIPGLDGVKLLKGLAVYGANGAGKSNVLLALYFLQHFVETSATALNQGDPTGVESFALDPETPNEPSEFVLRFLVDDTRYHYALAVDSKRVHFESLSAFPKGREQIWYQRTWDPKTGTYDWQPDRPADFKRDQNLVNYTKDNALFLSTAAKWNDKQIEPIYRWFKDGCRFLRLDNQFPQLPPAFTAKALMGDPNERSRILSLLVHADFGLLSAKADEHEITREQLPKNIPENVVAQILQQKSKGLQISFGHRGSGGKEYPLPWDRQSVGTQKYFALAGPWLDILKNGFFAGLDEMESSMHPLMVVELLRLLFSAEHNPRNAQVLFTTHNPLLLDLTLMRRDQIWFAEKDDEGASHLYPLTEYKARKDESLIRGYLSGRYQAVPFIPDGLLGREQSANAK